MNLLAANAGTRRAEEFLGVTESEYRQLLGVDPFEGSRVRPRGCVTGGSWVVDGGWAG